MRRLLLPLFALTSLLAGAAHAQPVSFVPIPTITPGVTTTKVEMLRSDLSLQNVQALFVPEGASGLNAPPQTLQVYIGPSTSRANPLLSLSSIASSGGMVLMRPVAGLTAVEVSFEVEAAPIRTAWKLPLLSLGDFFPPHSTAYVLNLVKSPDAASSLQIFNPSGTAATCSARVLRPKGSLVEERDGIAVPPVGVTRIPDLLRRIVAPDAAGINVAVTCDTPFYALGAFPATNRWDTRVEYPVTQLPVNPTAVTLDSRSGTFFQVVPVNSDLNIPLSLASSVNYHTLSIDFDVAVTNPTGFVVFRNVIGMFRVGGRRFGKTLFFGSFENFDKSKYVIDLGTPFIETTLKRNFPLQGGHSYHFTITLDNDQRSLHYVITTGNGAVVTDVLGGLYNDFNVVNGQAPVIEMGLGGIADNAYFPPYGWRFSNLRIVATK